MEGLALIRLMAAELAAGRAVVEAVVLETGGSVARGAGARMLMLGDGAFAGTVGGGAPEHEVQKLASGILAGAAAQRVRLDHESTGSVCGGWQLVGVRRVEPSEAPTYEEALAAVDEGRTVHMIVDWSADAPSAFFSLCDGCEPLGAPVLEGDVYTEPVVARERALVFGLGHVGRALARLLVTLDFDVLAFDNRPELAVAEAVPGAVVALADYARIADSVAISPRDYVCVMTHGHAADEIVCAQALAARPRYLGCMGSRRKRAVFEAALAREGFSPEEVARVELPIGLELGGETPAEVAVEVAARLVQVRHSVP